MSVSRLIVAFGVLVAAGCAHVAAPAPSAPRTPDLLALEAPPDAECEPRFTLETASGPLALCDASANVTTSVPCVQAEATRCFAEDAFGAPIYGWVHAAVLRDRRTIVGFVDSQIEGPAPELQLVISSDAGRTWQHRSSIAKPSWVALFHRFVAGDAWILEVEVEDGLDDDVPSGLYASTSSDEGRSWTPWIPVPSVAPGPRGSE